MPSQRLVFLTLSIVLLGCVNLCLSCGYKEYKGENVVLLSREMRQPNMFQSQNQQSNSLFRPNLQFVRGGGVITYKPLRLPFFMSLLLFFDIGNNSFPLMLVRNRGHFHSGCTIVNGANKTKEGDVKWLELHNWALFCSISWLSFSIYTIFFRLPNHDLLYLIERSSYPLCSWVEAAPIFSYCLKKCSEISPPGDQCLQSAGLLTFFRIFLDQRRLLARLVVCGIWAPFCWMPLAAGCNKYRQWCEHFAKHAE